MVLAIVLVILHLGRPFDYVLTGLRLPVSITLTALVIGLLSGGHRVFASRVGLPFVAFVAWMCLITPFSFWRGGSIWHILQYTYVTASVLVVVAAAPRSLSDVTRLFGITAIAPMLLLLIKGNPEKALGGAPDGTAGSSRMDLEGGMFANSADVALVAGFAIPFWLFLSLNFPLRMVRYPMAVLGTLFLLWATLLTGTRAALLGGAGMFVVYFIGSRFGGRLTLLAGVVVAAVAMPAVLPSSITQRLGTLVNVLSSSERDADPGGEAEQSAQHRREVLEDSLRITMRNPLTGVGPGQFVEYRWQESLGEGVRKQWLVTHNAYTQVSSESGLPGLLAFLAMLWGTWRTIRGIRPASSEPHPKASLVKSMRLCLMASFVYYAICGFFMSIEANVHPVLIGALALAAERASLRSQPSVVGVKRSHQTTGPATKPLPRRSSGDTRAELGEECRNEVQDPPRSSDA